MTCQVRFTRVFQVNDGELQRSLFGEPENDSTFVNQGDMRPPLLQDTKVHGRDPPGPGRRQSFARQYCGSQGHIKGYEVTFETNVCSIGLRSSSQFNISSFKKFVLLGIMFKTAGKKMSPSLLQRPFSVYEHYSFNITPVYGWMHEHWTGIGFQTRCDITNQARSPASSNQIINEQNIENEQPYSVRLCTYIILHTTDETLLG